MTALDYPLKVKQGADYDRKIPILGGSGATVGYSVVGQIRADRTPTAPLLATLDVTVDVIDGVLSVVLTIPAAQSAAWSWRAAFYDVELTTPDGKVVDFLEGLVVVRPQISR